MFLFAYNNYNFEFDLFFGFSSFYFHDGEFCLFTIRFSSNLLRFVHTQSCLSLFGCPHFFHLIFAYF